jgi:hypothetical protein
MKLPNWEKQVVNRARDIRNCFVNKLALALSERDLSKQQKRFALMHARDCMALHDNASARVSSQKPSLKTAAAITGTTWLKSFDFKSLSRENSPSSCILIANSVPNACKANNCYGTLVSSIPIMALFSMHGHSHLRSYCTNAVNAVTTGANGSHYGNK